MDCYEDGMRLYFQGEENMKKYLKTRGNYFVLFYFILFYFSKFIIDDNKKMKNWRMDNGKNLCIAYKYKNNIMKKYTYTWLELTEKKKN